MRFKGKVTLITGASRGIGREIALRLAEEGSDLILVARGSDALEATCRQCEEKGVRADLLAMDLLNPEALEEKVTQAIRTLPRVDHLVNNAGMTRDGLLMRMKRSDWEDVVQVNLTGAFLVTRAVVPLMVRARFGRIVNISSVVGLMGNPGHANYCASKAGLVGFSYSLARELAPRNITVNVVAPGFIETEMTAAMPESARAALLKQVPLGRAGSPREVAEGIVFLLSEEAGYVTGTLLNISGGLYMG